MVDLTYGTVAAVTLPALNVPGDGRPDVRVEVICSRSAGDVWVDLADRDIVYTDDLVVGNVRQLAVLDLTPPTNRPLIPIGQWIRQGGYTEVANQIEAQLPPERPNEPTRWGIVEASCVHEQTRREWIRGPLGWNPVGSLDDDGTADDWGDLIDPVVLRDGI